MKNYAEESVTLLSITDEQKEWLDEVWYLVIDQEIKLSHVQADALDIMRNNIVYRKIDRKWINQVRDIYIEWKRNHTKNSDINTF